MSNHSTQHGDAEVFAEIIDAIIGRFDGVNAVRDRAISDGRQIIRLAANTIRALHRGDSEEADRLAAQAESILHVLRKATEPHASIYWAGYVQDAMKEYAEARITAAILRDELAPSPKDLLVEDAPYLNALAEAASELRRDVLDLLRGGNLTRAESLLGRMDDTYAALIAIDFSDAVTGGLRRRTDQLRAVLERTRGDVTIALRQDRLEQALCSWESRSQLR